MYYRVKSMSIKDGDVCLVTAPSNDGGWQSTKLEGHEEMSTYKQLLEVGRGFYEGGFQFLKRSDCKAKMVYDNCKRRHGTWHSHRNEPDWKKHRERFACEFARRMSA